MTDIPKLDRPIYAALDLGTLDAQLQGVELRVLRNPTIRFRAGFRAASLNPQGPDWGAYVAAILDVAPDALMDTIGDLEQSIAQALFVTTFDSFDAEAVRFVGEQPAYILRVWDDYAAEKRKSYGGRS
jgi:hypothetical protein